MPFVYSSGVIVDSLQTFLNFCGQTSLIPQDHMIQLNAIQAVRVTQKEMAQTKFEVDTNYANKVYF